MAGGVYSVVYREKKIAEKERLGKGNRQRDEISVDDTVFKKGIMCEEIYAA